MTLNHYYSRQCLLPEVGREGQNRLKNAKCLVIGAGGLGSSSLLYLTAAGVGNIGICDGDFLEESNLHRQPIYFAKDIGKRKADLAATRLKELNPHITLTTHPFRLLPENALSLFSLYDLILDCTDNFRAKFLINDTAFFMKKAVVRASIYQFEGQIQSYLPKRGDACLRCLWEKIPEEGCVGTCQEVGVLGPLPGFFGILQAMEAIKFFLNMPVLSSHEILFTDLIHYNQRIIAFEKRTNCPLCGENPSILTLVQTSLWEIEHKDLDKGDFVLVDIREHEETKSRPYTAGPHLTMPLHSFDATSLQAQLKYAFFCQKGKRSSALVRSLRERGMTNVFSVMGGIDQYK